MNALICRCPKNEVCHRQPLPARARARFTLAGCIEVFCKWKRLHVSAGTGRSAGQVPPGALRRMRDCRVLVACAARMGLRATLPEMLI